MGLDDVWFYLIISGIVIFVVGIIVTIGTIVYKKRKMMKCMEEVKSDNSEKNEVVVPVAISEEKLVE